MKKKNCSFEEDYYESYFTKEVTAFDEKGAQRMCNWFKVLASALQDYVDIESGHNKTAIEFGCALGAASKVLSDLGYKVLATDISNYSIKRAKKLFPDVRFQKHDIQKPFKNGKFDLVCAFDVIEHLEDPYKAIKNMYNITERGGYTICSTPNDYEYARNIPTHINVKKPEEWKKLFAKAGFSHILIKQVSILPFFYRFHWRLQFVLPFGINFELIPSPVFIIARK